MSRENKRRGVYRNSSFYSALKENKLNLPDPQPLPQSSDPYWEFHPENDEIPIVFVGDDAFPLSEHCMKPYGLKNTSDMERVFDYRLSRFRRISENGFDISSNRFRLFSTIAVLTPDKAVIAIMANLALHNMLRTKSSESYTPTSFADFEIPNGNVMENGVNAQHLILPLFNVKTVEDKVYLESKFDKNCVIILMDQVKSLGNGECLLREL